MKPRRRRKQVPRSLQVEADVQSEIVFEAQKLRLTVIEFSQHMAFSRSHTPGVADLIIGDPVRKTWCWFECKKPGGKASPDQLKFRDLVTDLGHAYHIGGLHEFREWLRFAGIPFEVQETLV